MKQQATAITAAGGLKTKIILIIIGVFAVGAAVTYSFWQTSDKDAYFKAEIDTYNYMKDLLVERFDDELQWKELTESKPTEMTLDATVQYNDPNQFGGFNGISEMINQSSLELKAATDMKNKQMLLDAELNIAGITLEDLQFYLTDQSLTINLPFLDDALQIQSEDLSTILHEIDPYMFSEGEEFDFNRFFDLENYPMAAKDKQYLQENYGKFLYEILPEAAFSKEKDSLTINNESINADKITVQLTESQIKTILTDLLTKAEKDDQLKEIVETYMRNSYVNAEEIDMLLNDFDEELAHAKEIIEEMPFQGEIQSTIWVNKGLIVQREFVISGKDEFDQLSTVNISGIHQLRKSHQVFDYDFSFENDDAANNVALLVDLSKDGKQIDDQIIIELDDMEIVYAGIETIDRSERDFKRSISLNNPYEEMSIHWDGSANYSKDQMSAMIEFYVKSDELGGEFFTLNLNVASKEIRSVEKPEFKQIKDIGQMTEAELENYIFNEAQPQLFKWFLLNVGLPSF